MSRDPLYDDRGRPRWRLLPTDGVTLGIFLTTLLGLALRLVHLGEQSLWVDELLTIQQGNMPGHGLLEQFLDDVHGPLPMIVAAWTRIFTESEFWLRLPSALLGAATVPLLFAVGRRLAGERVGLFAALLLAVNPMHVDHSQEVRGYAYLLFFGLAAILWALDHAPQLSLRGGVVLTLLGVAAGLSNLQGLFWMGGLALGLVLSGRVPLRGALRWTLPFLAMLLLLSPWWLDSLGVHAAERLLPTEETGAALREGTTWSVWALPYAGFVLAFGRSLGPDVASLHASGGSIASIDWGWLMPVVGLTIPLVLLLLGSGLSALGRRNREVLSWTAVPLAIAVVLAIRNVKPFNPRYVISAMPALLILFAAGLDRFPRRSSALLLAALLSISGISLARYYFDPAYGHADVRQAAGMIEARDGVDDAVLVPGVNLVFAHYYDGDAPLLAHPRGTLGSPATPEETIATFAPAKRFLWYVRARAWATDPDGEIQAVLDRGFRRISRTEFDGVRVDLYDREQPPVEDDDAEVESSGAEN